MTKTNAKTKQNAKVSTKSDTSKNTPKVAVNKATPNKITRVPYKKLNQELEGKLLARQHDLKVANKEIASLKEEMADRMVYKADLTNSSFWQNTSTWLDYKSAGAQATFYLATGVITLLSALGVYHIIS